MSLLSVDSTSPLCILFFDIDLGSLLGDVVEGAIILLSGRAGGRPTARDGEDGCRESVDLLGDRDMWWETGDACQGLVAERHEGGAKLYI